MRDDVVDVVVFAGELDQVAAEGVKHALGAVLEARQHRGGEGLAAVFDPEHEMQLKEVNGVRTGTGRGARAVAVKNTKRRRKRDPASERGRRAARYRAYPTVEQVELMRRFAGSCRLVKNLAKEQREFAWQLGRNRVSYSAQTADLKELRDDPKVAPWLAEVPSQVLQQAIRDTDDAFGRFFSGQGRYPRWVRKGGVESFRDPQGVKVRHVSKRWGKVWLQKVGWVRVRLHRALVRSRICSATWTIEPDGKVFVSVLVEVRKRQPSKPRIAGPGSEIGVDRGVQVAVATSDGELIDRDMWTASERTRLVRLERQRERQKTMRRKDKRQQKSNRQQKTERRIAAMHARARRRRQDFVEQISCDLAKNHSLVVFEDLRVKSMTATAKGTIEEPGKNVRQKAGLNRAILNKGWGAVRDRTAVKALRHGHRVVAVPAAHTSRTCPECGLVDEASRATRSMFICASCGYQAHADTNAAQEILRRGIKLASAGGTPVAARPSTNREPEPASAGKSAEPSATAGRESGNNQATGRITEEAT